MPGRECYHCKQWVEEGEPHDCWTTTEAALTRDLAEDVREAWERLRETAAGFGEQRIYASHNSIMFARKSCYFFVRPKRTCLEICIFLGRTISAPQIRRVEPASKVKMVHVVRVSHRDEVEPPLTGWLREAYELQDRLAAANQPARRTADSSPPSRRLAKGRPPSKRRPPATGGRGVSPATRPPGKSTRKKAGKTSRRR